MRWLLLVAGVLSFSLAFMAPQEAAAQNADTRVLGKTAAEWVKMLQEDPQARRRRGALIALELVGPGSTIVLPAVQGALKKDKDEGVRKDAAVLLGKLVPRIQDDDRTPVDAIDALAAALQKDEAASVREAAAQALGRIGPDARSAVGALGTAMKDKQPAVRAMAAETLGRMGPDALPAAPALAEALRDEKADEFTRRFAAIALGQLGTDASRDSVPALAVVLAAADAPATVRSAAADAVGRLGPSAAGSADALATAVGDKNLQVRRSAVLALSKLGDAGRVGVPALLQASEAEDRALRAQVYYALGELGGSSTDKVVPVLVKGLEDKVVDVRVAAVLALGKLGPGAAAAVPALTNLQRDARPAVRDAVVEALKKIKGEKESVPPAKSDGGAGG